MSKLEWIIMVIVLTVYGWSMTSLFGALSDFQGILLGGGL